MRPKAKLILLVFFIIMSGEILAQTFSINMCSNYSILHFTGDEHYSGYDRFKAGYDFGVKVGFPAYKTVSVETGLFFSSRGYKFKTVQTYNDIKSRYVLRFNFNYLDIPLMSKVNIEIRDSKYFGAFGPYFGIGLFSYGKEIAHSDNEVTKIIVKKFEYGTDFKRFDFGLSFAAGVEISSFTFSFNHGLGLVNIACSATTDDNIKIMHRVWGLSVGYKFGK